ncbi:hypothetical protein FRZ61_37550 [Hypericibacter adhaerens]|jgi:hypothetical protein|uniref:Uncharacterized protein n=1 Tax=Hypericibacter adhaerens TaxID=2602016 RepID=A0A5J6N8Y5_9PROT|nr:hypothetical protein FRZ61_37550 [Hypericibacter adhaerens]
MGEGEGGGGAVNAFYDPPFLTFPPRGEGMVSRGGGASSYIPAAFDIPPAARNSTRHRQ